MIPSSRSIRRLVCVTLITVIVPVLASASSPAATTYHTDHRQTPKLETEPDWRNSAGLTGEPMARAFLTDNSLRYGFAADLSNLRLVSTRESLLGTHYRYQQHADGIPIHSGEITVSVSRAMGKIYRVYNHTFPAKPGTFATSAAAVSSEGAYDAAWQHLRAHGDLAGAPASKLVWLPEGDSFRLSWIVDLPLTAPYGGWQVRVDARTGEVVDTRDTRLYRIRDEFVKRPISERIGAYMGPLRDRLEAFAQFEVQRASQQDGPFGAVVDGSGQVFDPDPRTTLQDDNLQDGAAPASFTAAYFTRTLLDITETTGTYTLVGPWVQIINFDPPATAPSTTNDGNWTATRGDNAFNDAMTYFHLDQSQRYIQSLGFTGASGIQELSIGADSDGFNGADNSFYQPGSNRLSFGHGCVDDNEDADVILHEYGHAITHGINSSWGGGDAGAMGEGFGDYWAGSYSYSTPNGASYHPEWVYSWDGHGTGDLCWSGRIMDAFGATYVHTTTYGAHSSIPGGFVSDELWSTPLFQALVELTGQAVPRSEVDQIILEAMFGLGSGIKMRDMANSIILTAATLHPSGPHSQVFTDKFLVHDIVEVQAAVLAGEDPNPTSAGGNGVPDPGEVVDLQIDITNNGTLTATAVSAILSTTTPGVVIVAGNANYPDILPGGGSESPLTDYTLALPSNFPCGDPVDLSLLVTYDDGEASLATIDVQMFVGTPVALNESVSPGLAIPDDNSTGITSQITVTGSVANVSPGLNVDLNITHTWIGDLIVSLTSPSNTTVVLHNRTGSSADNIVGNYPGTLPPDEALSAFSGEPLDGMWTLTVSDNVGLDTGTLNSWGINDVSDYTCEVVVGIGDDRVPSAFRVFGAAPNPFSSGTALRFEVPGGGADVTVDIFDVAGRRVRTVSRGFRDPGAHVVTWNGLNDAGRQASTGVYFYRITSGAFSESRKMMLVR